MPATRSYPELPVRRASRRGTPPLIDVPHMITCSQRIPPSVAYLGKGESSSPCFSPSFDCPPPPTILAPPTGESPVSWWGSAWAGAVLLFARAYRSEGRPHRCLRIETLSKFELPGRSFHSSVALYEKAAGRYSRAVPKARATKLVIVFTYTINNRHLLPRWACSLLALRLAGAGLLGRLLLEIPRLPPRPAHGSARHFCLRPQMLSVLTQRFFQPRSPKLESSPLRASRT
jgi:hypothetical protein